MSSKKKTKSVSFCKREETFKEEKRFEIIR